MRTRIAIIVAAALLAVSVPVWAHHAFSSEFDVNHPVKLTGTVVKMEWINPHSWIHMNVKGKDGKVAEWMVEGGSPNSLLRRGFTKEALPAGAEIVVDGYQAKDGSNRATGMEILFSDGKKLFLGGTAEQAQPGASK
jgi:hypothetical protein